MGTLFSTLKQSIFIVLGSLCIAALPAHLDTFVPVQAIRQSGLPSFSLPFSAAPGPTTWLIGQQYGNTSSAYNFGKYWYGTGQGLHFGLDFAAPCKTPVVAIGDGIVDSVDNFQYGLLPHNVAIFHPDSGLVSLYGHLYEKSLLQKGQPIKSGMLVGYSGDPDLTCVSRPHLHLEIRSRDYETAFSPAKFINADWPALSSIGYYSFGGFIKDLHDTRAWQTAFEQPVIQFNGKSLNSYDGGWPLTTRVSPPPVTLPQHTAQAIDEDAHLFTRLTSPGCCSQPWWSADSHSVRYLDGPPGQLASMMYVNTDTDPSASHQPQALGSVPPELQSADGKYTVKWQSARARVTRNGDNISWSLVTGGWPTPSPGDQWLLWQYSAADNVPNFSAPTTEIWIAKMDGTAATLVANQKGGSAFWLDDNRLLLVSHQNLTNVYTLSVYSISNRAPSPLVTVINLRGLSIAPGGEHLMYYTPFQDNPSESGIYLLDSKAGTLPVKMPFFGSWRWRDSASVLYIPFAPGKPMALKLYNIATGQSDQVTDPVKQPFETANDDWSVSPDGHAVVIWSAQDYALWLIQLAKAS